MPPRNASLLERREHAAAASGHKVTTRTATLAERAACGHATPRGAWVAVCTCGWMSTPAGGADAPLARIQHIIAVTPELDGAR